MDTSDQFQLLYKVKKFIKKFSTKENDGNLQELYYEKKNKHFRKIYYYIKRCLI